MDFIGWFNYLVLSHAPVISLLYFRRSIGFGLDPHRIALATGWRSNGSSGTTEYLIGQLENRCGLAVQVECGEYFQINL